MADTGVPWSLPFPELNDIPDVPADMESLARAVHAQLTSVQNGATAGVAAAAAAAANASTRVAKAGDTMSGTLKIETPVGNDATVWLKNGQDVGFVLRVESGTDNGILERAGGPRHFTLGKAGWIDIVGPSTFYGGIGMPNVGNVTTAQGINWFWLVTEANGSVRRLDDISFRLIVAGIAQSSRRFKTEITKAGSAPDVTSLQPRAFQWKKDGVNDVVHPGGRLGLIAEEVAEVDERLVTRDAEGEIQGLDTNALIASLIAEVKNLREEITALKHA